MLNSTTSGFCRQLQRKNNRKRSRCTPVCRAREPHYFLLVCVADASWLHLPQRHWCPRSSLNDIKHNQHVLFFLYEMIIEFVDVCWPKWCFDFFLTIIPDGSLSVATGYLFIPLTAVQTLHSVCFIEIDAHLWGNSLKLLLAGSSTQQLLDVNLEFPQ